MSGTMFDEISNEGEWFTYFGSHIDKDNKVVYEDPLPGAGRIRLRDFTPFIQEQIQKRKKIYEFVLNPKSESMERIGYFEDIPLEQARKESEDVWDYAITGLENFYIGDRAIECTKEGKNELMKYPAFDRCVAKCLSLLNEAKAKAKEEQEKNSLPT